MWASLDDLKNGAEPERLLKKGDTVAVEKSYVWDGQRYWISVDGKVVPTAHTAMMGGGAEWHGIELNDKTPLPFGWVTPDKANVYARAAGGEAGQARRPARAAHARRHRRRAHGRAQKVAQGHRRRSAAAGDLRRHHGGERPAQGGQERRGDTAARRGRDAGRGAASRIRSRSCPRSGSRPTRSTRCGCSSAPRRCRPTSRKWIDVDVGEQVLVTYENDKPTFATLISSGRAIPTPMGTYPVWAKVSAITMKNQPYEDKPYYVNKVPWSTLLPVAQRDPRRLLARPLRRLEVARLRQRVAARRAPHLRVDRSAAAARLDGLAPARAVEVAVRGGAQLAHEAAVPAGPADRAARSRARGAAARGGRRRARGGGGAGRAGRGQRRRAARRHGRAAAGRAGNAQPGAPSASPSTPPRRPRPTVPSVAAAVAAPPVEALRPPARRASRRRRRSGPRSPRARQRRRARQRPRQRASRAGCAAQSPRSAAPRTRSTPGTAPSSTPPRDRPCAPR